MKHSTTPSSRTRILTAGAAALLASFDSVQGQAISISGPSTYSQNFDTLPFVAGTTWTDNGTLPGWYARTDSLTSGTLPIGIYNTGNTTLAAGFLSTGDAATTERSLGSRPTTNGYGMVLMGVLFQNTSASPLVVGEVNYNGELYTTQSVANTVDGYQFFYQTGATPITSLTPFTLNNGASYAANAAVADAGWTRLAALDYSDFNSLASVTFTPAIVKNVRIVSAGITLMPSEYLMLRWRNPNDANTDATMSIDDLSVTFSTLPKTYNLSHTVGGAPDGVLVVSSSEYWLFGSTPVGLAAGDAVAFSQNIIGGTGTATITAPAAVTLGSITLGNTIGTYTINTDADVTVGGIVGGGTRPLRKTGSAALIITGSSIAPAGLVLDEGTIRIGSTGSGALEGPISTSGGVLTTGGIVVSASGAATIGGGEAAANSYLGTTIVQSGTLIASKAAGTTAIPGDFVLQSGAVFRYSGNTGGNQIADTASITIDGGAFGDITAPGANPTNPGAAETVADVAITASGGLPSNFSTGRAAFTATGAFRVLAGKALAHRAGTISASAVEIGPGASIDLDGGSTTASTGYSRLTVGVGGLALNDGTINLNAAASAVSATSVGSIVALNGEVTSTGASKILDVRTAVMTGATATVDLGGTDRLFDVSDTLDIGTDAAPVSVVNGGIVKEGTGTLTLTQSATLSTLTINGGTVALLDSVPPPAPALELANAAQAVPEPGMLGLLAIGALGLCRRTRR
jgi:hypothetical protein